jgi:hypothetical protein
VYEQDEEAKGHKEKKGTFMQKLYEDDDEFDELKVMGMVDEDD